MGTGCKPVGSAYLGSNPRAPTILAFLKPAWSSDQAGFFNANPSMIVLLYICSLAALHLAVSCIGQAFG